MILATLAALLAQVEAPPKVNRTVKIDGKSYRVETKGAVVKVFDKSVFTGRSPEAGRRLRSAVLAATGCRITEEYWEAAHLAGMLDCTPANAQSSDER